MSEKSPQGWDPRLFAVGVFVQAWFEEQKPKRQRAYVRRCRYLVRQYSQGRRQSVPAMPDEMRHEAATVLTWIAALCDNLERLIPD